MDGCCETDRLTHSQHETTGNKNNTVQIRAKNQKTKITLTHTHWLLYRRHNESGGQTDQHATVENATQPATKVHIFNTQITHSIDDHNHNKHCTKAYFYGYSIVLATPQFWVREWVEFSCRPFRRQIHPVHLSYSVGDDQRELGLFIFTCHHRVAQKYLHTKTNN